MRQLSRLAKLVTHNQRTVAITACIGFLVTGFSKFLIVVFLLSMGVPKRVLQAQDAILTGVLAAALLWVLLAAVRVRQKHEQQQIRIAADLNHHLRNALTVILASEYLRESERAAAILESVERIDRTLRVLLPYPSTPATAQWSKIQTNPQGRDADRTKERRKAPRRPAQP